MTADSAADTADRLVPQVPEIGNNYYPVTFKLPYRV
jgi:hypothetical protein